MTRMTTTVRYPTREARDAVLRTQMERGAGESYDRLDALLASAPTTTTEVQTLDPTLRGKLR